MENQNGYLLKCALFAGMTEKEVNETVQQCRGRKKQYRKGERILTAGAVTGEAGVVLYGSALIENVDLWGNRTLLDVLQPGGVFAESYAIVPGEPLMVDVTAGTETEVLFLRLEEEIPAKLLRNLLQLSARKNLHLSRRIFHSSAKTIRERVISYLSYLARMQQSNRITVPLNRQEMADYLGVERSALSGELGKMKRDGLIEFHKNVFVLQTDTEAETPGIRFY